MINKKIFHIAVELDLTKKPEWLDDFRVKYDKPYPKHITLKTNTFFDPNNFENLKKDFIDIAQKYKTIGITFDELYISPGTHGECIMIKARKNQEIVDLQKEIADKFSKYGQHITLMHEKFEKNFQPHLTIARHLTTEQLKNAKKELRPDLLCSGLIKELVLTTVESDRFEEWSDPKNKIRYELKNK